MILAIRTDSAETTLVLMRDGEEAQRLQWVSGRRLSIELLSKILEMLKKQQSDWKELTGIVIFAGPGSFTGLRIGITVANSLSYSLGIPVVAGRGDDWTTKGCIDLKDAAPGNYVLPEYGAEANITAPKK